MGEVIFQYRDIKRLHIRMFGGSAVELLPPSSIYITIYIKPVLSRLCFLSSDNQQCPGARVLFRTHGRLFLSFEAASIDIPGPANLEVAGRLKVARYWLPFASGRCDNRVLHVL
jgi:hypothetical protein